MWCSGVSTCGFDVTPTDVGTFIPGQNRVSFALSLKVQDALQSEIPQNPEPPERGTITRTQMENSTRDRDPV